MKSMNSHRFMYYFVPIVAIGWIPRLHSQEDNEQTPINDPRATFSGSWTGSQMSARFILELEENMNATLTGISAQILRNAFFEPALSHGTYEVIEGESAAELSLIVDNRKAVYRCFLEDRTHLKCFVGTEDAIEFTKIDDAEFDWSLWGTYYYLNPLPEKFTRAAIAMAKSGVLDQARHTIADLRMLMSSVMAQNPGRIGEWMREVDRDAHKTFWDDVLYYSRTKEGTDILLEEGKKKGRRFARFVEQGAPIAHEIDPEGADTIDLNWGYFFATGDTRAVHNVIRAFAHAEYEPFIEAWENSKKTRKDAKNYNLGAAYRAARWSIHANCTQHSRVLRFCDDLLQSGNVTPAESTTLSSILSSADVEMARRHYDAK
jgi:hypothetical protein